MIIVCYWLFVIGRLQNEQLITNDKGGATGVPTSLGMNFLTALR